MQQSDYYAAQIAANIRFLCSFQETAFRMNGMAIASWLEAHRRIYGKSSEEVKT